MASEKCFICSREIWDWRDAVVPQNTRVRLMRLRTPFPPSTSLDCILSRKGR